MVFRIEVDDAAVLEQIDQTLNDLASLELALPNVFMDWQRDDMNRSFPKVEGSGLSYSTTIYPRSRLRRPSNVKQGGKQARRRARVAAGRPGAQRPILRPELFDQLKERMVDMLKETVVWQ